LSSKLSGKAPYEARHSPCLLREFDTCPTCAGNAAVLEAGNGCIASEIMQASEKSITLFMIIISFIELLTDRILPPN
jgi:hypothetical protein